MIFSKKLKFIIYFLLTILIIPLPVYAYGGPGIAIAGLIVFITVLLAFFASVFLRIYLLLKKFFNFIRKNIKKIKRIKKKK
tara:strand:- start:2037 stop:2279 length:243 start_codon:yes stop_codon:yes gene_type:complete